MFGVLRKQREEGPKVFEDPISGLHGVLRRPVHAERGEHATRGLNRCVNHT